VSGRARWRGDRKFFRPPLNSTCHRTQNVSNRIFCCCMLPCGALKLCFTLKSCFFSMLWTLAHFSQRRSFVFHHVLDSFGKNTGGGVPLQRFGVSAQQSQSELALALCFRVCAFIGARKQPEILCAAMAASVCRPSGRAKGWNLTLRYSPRPHGASSSRQMLSRPPQSGHCS